ncbi:type II toxin-antitoxin system RelB/DinJ family antitoxin [Thiofilum flexile]|uniref:type II toxin-antitoxin system RelB/DinJ family antitoxin n=1 Tax=Thiofilum flexile TaxID=125627 RepID=UPI000382C5E1|nr:type II toxin-antitoxin system RelB/DinJ family antitoxin [Thiofilum flexile]
MKTAIINARVVPELKQDVEDILSRLGITTTQAIVMYFEQIKLNNGIPFALRLPNEETIAAMKAARSEKGEPVTLDQLRDSLT